MLLADLGADVVKVESPEGDSTRSTGAGRDGLSWYFAAFNRNKRSIVLDLKREADREVLARLIARADVLVENFRPGVLAALGFPPDRLEALNPRLVTCSINGFGSTGPYAERPAFDFIAQAMSGFMATNGWDGGPPLRAAAPITDLLAGLYAALATLAALRARDASGRGQRVEAAMLTSMVATLGYLVPEYLATGRPPPRTGNDHPILAPYGLFRTADRPIAVAPASAPIVRRFLAALGLEALLAEPCFASNAERVRHREELRARIEAVLASAPAAEWIARLNAAGVPCGPVNGLAEALADPQLLAQEMVLEMEQPGLGLVRTTGFPMKLAATPCRLRRPAPGLGEHGSEILAELGQGPLEAGPAAPARAEQEGSGAQVAGLEVQLEHGAGHAGEAGELAVRRQRPEGAPVVDQGGEVRVGEQRPERGRGDALGAAGRDRVEPGGEPGGDAPPAPPGRPEIGEG
jgi:crotonobetainyl-CoA:carnitine CoA-transferase CaiB-like acyl-CoA transferase